MDVSVHGRADSDIADPPGSASVRSRRPWWVWAVPFAVVLGAMLIRNAFLFSTPLYEDADMGADSILIEHARRFSLLVGNYSREGFNHPGPAFLYVQSWGETLFWSVLHVVPTAWNGQLIAMYALNALFVALIVGIGYGWTKWLGGALAVFAVVLAFGLTRPDVFSVDWMPYIYVLPYLTFLIAIASVAAGRIADVWIAGIAGWFCVHGHACFLFFVPVLTGCAVIALAWPRRRRLGSAIGSFFAKQRRVWIPAVVISLLFLVPVAAELALHWPGNFGKYFGYTSTSKTAGTHTLSQIIGYVLWFWWPHQDAWAVVIAAFAVAGAAVWLCPAGPIRRLCAFLLAFNTVSFLLAIAYTGIAIDTLADHYIGYFYWTGPAVMLLIVVLAAVAAVARAPRGYLHAATAVAACAAIVAGAAFAAAPGTRTNTAWVDPARPYKTQRVTDPALPAGIARLAALAGGKPIVLEIDHDAWPSVTGMFLQAERSGVRACAANSYWTFMMSSQFICTPAELAQGKKFWVWPLTAVPSRVPVLYRFNQATVTSEKGHGVVKL
jgi:hypothetical protein